MFEIAIDFFFVKIALKNENLRDGWPQYNIYINGFHNLNIHPSSRVKLKRNFGILVFFHKLKSE